MLHSQRYVKYTQRQYIKLWVSILTGFSCFQIQGAHTVGRGQFKCDSIRAENRFRHTAKRTSPFKSAGASVQSTTGSRGVRISDSNAGYTMFRGSVKGTGYPLHSPVSSFTSPTLRHRVPSYFNWSLSWLAKSPNFSHGSTDNAHCSLKTCSWITFGCQPMPSEMKCMNYLLRK